MKEVENEWVQFKEMKVQEMEHFKEYTEKMEKYTAVQQEKNKLKKMDMYIKLTSQEHLDDRKKKMLENLERELFGN